jgi:hypothetical protein
MLVYGTRLGNVNEIGQKMRLMYEPPYSMDDLEYFEWINTVITEEGIWLDYVPENGDGGVYLNLLENNSEPEAGEPEAGEPSGYRQFMESKCFMPYAPPRKIKIENSFSF